MTLAELLRYMPADPGTSDPMSGVVTSVPPESYQNDAARRRATLNAYESGTLPPPNNPIPAEDWGPRWEAAGAAAVDPMGLTSGALDYVAPSMASVLRGAQAEHPDAALAGGVMSPVGPAMLGLAGKGVSALGRAVMAAPKTTAAVTGGTAALAPSAMGADKSAETDIEAAIGDRADLKAIYAEIQALDEKSRAAVKGVNRASSDRIRQEAADRAAGLREKLFAELQKAEAANTPFRDTMIGRNYGFIQPALPLAFGLAVKGGQNLLANRGPKALDNAIGAYEKARGKGSTADQAYQAGKVDQIAKKMQAGPTSAGGKAAESIRESVPATLAGGVVGAESNLLPYQYDMRSAKPGSKEKAEAEAKIGDLGGWLTTAAQGAGLGVLAGQTASHLGQFGKMRPALGEAANIANQTSKKGVEGVKAVANANRAGQEADQALRSLGRAEQPGVLDRLLGREPAKPGSVATETGAGPPTPLQTQRQPQGGASQAPKRLPSPNPNKTEREALFTEVRGRMMGGQDLANMKPADISARLNIPEEKVTKYLSNVNDAVKKMPQGSTRTDILSILKTVRDNAGKIAVTGTAGAAASDIIEDKSSPTGYRDPTSGQFVAGGQ